MAAPAEGLEGAPLAELIHPEDREEALALLARIADTGSSAGPVQWRMRGRSGWIEVETIATSQLDDPDVAGVVLNSREVTERRRLEAQLRQSQRLESVGQLAGGVAHDFNNFLSVIRGYAGFLEQSLPADSPLRADAGEISQAAERAARLTNQLLVFSRRDVVRSRVLDLGELLLGMRTLLDRSVGEAVELRVDAPEAAVARRGRPEPGRAGADEPRRQRPRRDARRRHARAAPGERLPRRRRAGTGRRGAGRHVRLRVRDSGAGMPPEVVEHAFEPFYTTKPKGAGHRPRAGHRLRDRDPGPWQHRDLLDARRGHRRRGAAARDRRRAGARRRARGRRRRDPGAARRSSIVEDEDAVRRLTQRILSRAGYTVIEAVGGPAAMAAWEAHEGAIDLLLTDVVMPGMSGKELADRLGVVPVFMSGYTDDVVLRHGVEAGRPRLVQKPFDADTLLAAVRAALDEGQASAGCDSRQA